VHDTIRHYTLHYNMKAILVYHSVLDLTPLEMDKVRYCNHITMYSRKFCSLSDIVTGIVFTTAAAITIDSKIAPNNLVFGAMSKVPRLPQTIKTFFKSFDQSHYNMLRF